MTQHDETDPFSLNSSSFTANQKAKPAKMLTFFYKVVYSTGYKHCKYISMHIYIHTLIYMN